MILRRLAVLAAALAVLSPSVASAQRLADVVEDVYNENLSNCQPVRAQGTCAGFAGESTVIPPDALDAQIKAYRDGVTSKCLRESNRPPEAVSLALCQIAVAQCAGSYPLIKPNGTADEMLEAVAFILTKDVRDSITQSPLRQAPKKMLCRASCLAAVQFFKTCDARFGGVVSGDPCKQLPTADCVGVPGDNVKAASAAASSGIELDAMKLVSAVFVFALSTFALLH